MKKNLCILTAVAALGAGSSAHAQGLLSLGGSDEEFGRKLPFSVTVGLGVGYDTNPSSSSSDEKGTGYLSGTIRAEYADGDRRTHYALSLEYSPFFYFDAPEGMEDFLQDASLGFSIVHKASSRLTISDNFYLAYEFEPDYNIGASISRRNDQYLYGYNSLAVAYKWTPRFSTVSSYTISGIQYDNSALSGEEYLSHTLAQEFRYALSRVTTAAVTYRYTIANYDNGFGDYTSQYFLAGLDHSFGPKTVGSFRVGAEVRDRDNGGSSSTPYFEGSLSHRVAKQTNFRWYHRLGFEDSDIGQFTKRTSYRTGLSLEQRFNSRLAGNAGLHYIHDEFDGGPGAFNEDVVALQLGLDYNVYRNVILNTGYSFTTSNSGNDFRDYDRHIFSVGVSARF